MKRSYLLPIFLIVSVDILGLTIVLPLLPFYAEKYGASPFVVGLIVTTFAFCQLVSGPILGQLSDRVGRKPMLIVSQIGTFIGFLVLAYADSLWMIFAARILDGITAGNLSLAQAYISDVTAAKDRAKSFAVIGIAFGMGFLIGPAISGYLSQFGYATPILAAAGLSLLSVICTATLLEANPPLAEAPEANDGGVVPPAGKRLGFSAWGRYVDYFKTPGLGDALWRFWLFAFAFSLQVSGLALFAERRYTHGGLPFGPKEVGYLYAYAGFLGIFIQGGLVGRLVKRMGEDKVSTIAFASAVIGYVWLGQSYTIPMLLVAATFAAFGTGILRPSLTSLVTQRAPRREQGAVLGLTQSLNSLGTIVAPLVSGALIEHHRLVEWSLTAALVAALGFLFGIIRRRPVMAG